MATAGFVAWFGDGTNLKQTPQNGPAALFKKGSIIADESTRAVVVAAAVITGVVVVVVIIDMASPLSLNINMWDSLCPVLLPVGQKTMPSIGMASVGLVIPFAIFVLAMFIYMNKIWHANVRPDNNSAGPKAEGTHTIYTYAEYTTPVPRVFSDPAAGPLRFALGGGDGGPAATFGWPSQNNFFSSFRPSSFYFQ